MRDTLKNNKQHLEITMVTLYKKICLLSLLVFACFKTIGQAYEYEYECDEELCEISEKPVDAKKYTKIIRGQNPESPYKTLFISDNLDVDFGNTLAETTRLLLKRMDLEHHEQNFARCFDTTQSFLRCTDSPDKQKMLEQLKQQKGLKEGGKYYGKDFFITDVTARACNDLGLRIAIINKTDKAFMGYIEFAAPRFPKAGAPVQIYLLPEFRGRDYAEEALMASIDYVSQFFGRKYSSLDSNPAYQLMTEVASKVAGATDFAQARNVKHFLEAFSKAMAKACSQTAVKDQAEKLIFDKIWAVIRRSNQRSIDLFTKIGFCFHHGDSIDSYYQYPC